VGLLLIDCWVWISLAMSRGFVSVLLCLSLIQSSEFDSCLLKTILCIRLGFFSYTCLYLDIAFLTHSRVYFVVIARAWVFAVLAIVAIVMSHSCCWCPWSGRGGMLVCLWFLSVSIMGCVCQCMVCFAR
jgi:hypothetical protein